MLFAAARAAEFDESRRNCRNPEWDHWHDGRPILSYPAIGYPNFSMRHFNFNSVLDDCNLLRRLENHEVLSFLLALYILF